MQTRKILAFGKLMAATLKASRATSVLKSPKGPFYAAMTVERKILLLITGVVEIVGPVRCQQ